MMSGISGKGRSKPKIFLFLDERYERSPVSTRFIVACVVVDNGVWKDAEPEVQALLSLRKTRRLNALIDFLNKAKCFAMLNYADIPSNCLGKDELDYSEDAGLISRENNIWSTLVSMTVTAALRRLGNYHIASTNVRICHDPKSLTDRHRTIFHQVLANTIPEIASEFGDFYVVQTIEEVPKAKKEDKPNPFQWGTALADELCSNINRCIKRGSIGRLECKDLSHHLLNTLQLYNLFGSTRTK